MILIKALRNCGIVNILDFEKRKSQVDLDESWFGKQKLPEREYILIAVCLCCRFLALSLTINFFERFLFWFMY